MLTKLEQVREKWGGLSTPIDHWLTARQELLISYFRLAGLPPYENEQPTPQSLQAFCDSLVDYVSKGHFEIYNQLVEQAEAFSLGTQKRAKALYLRITESTESALNFNDKFGSVHDELDDRWLELHQELSELGELMAARFAYEDKLLNLIGKQLATLQVA